MADEPTPEQDLRRVWVDPKRPAARSSAAREWFQASPRGVATPTPSTEVCTPWVTAQQVADAYDPTATDVTIYANVALMASDILYRLSARIYPGTCTATVRPCRDACGCWAAAGMGPGWSWPITSWTGLGWSDGCGGSCGCGYEHRIRLPDQPVTAITAVKIDGTALAATGIYRLEQQRYLARIDGLTWPACQNMSLATDAVGTFTIAYEYGEQPPILGRQAAAELAYSLYLQAHGGECRLPEAATSVTRQGVTYQTNTIYDAIGMRPSGLAYVDAFLASVNPNRWRHRPYTWSPDQRTVRSA